MADKIDSQLIRRSLKIALVFQIGWVITGLIFSLFGAKVSWVLLVANMLTLWAPALFMIVTRLNLSDKFQVGFAIFITASSLIGSALGGYGGIPNWDTIVHVYSGTMLAWFGFIIATNAEVSIKKPLPLWFKNTVAFMTPLAFAAVWEIYEYASDVFLGTTMQAGGLQDTIIDMLAAFIGATVALIISILWFGNQRNRSQKK
ncbi:MAG: hypothetical protein WAQ27_01060 [Candidatus Microsaccharimonas sp.]